ncbi:MAG TPA: TonB family protein [Pyrinomonadaceae bacterium]|jgi:protein TonB
MFSNLVESDLHTQEHVRRSWFFLGTMAAYALILMIAGVVSIYAYDAHLEEQTNEYIVTFVPPIQPNEAQPQRNNQPRPAAAIGDTTRSIAERVEPVARINDSTKPPDNISSAPAKVRELPSNGPVAFTGRDVDVVSGGISGGLPGGPSSTGDGQRPVPVEIETPPPPRVVPTPQPVKILRTTKVLNSEALSLPKPIYPKLARDARISGTVTVQVLIDETGKVISAQSINGHPLLLPAAVQAARQARFSPTVLGDRPVKVSGVITYNFIL